MLSTGSSARACERAIELAALPPRMFIGFADFASQITDRSGGIAVWIPGFLASLQQNCTAPFGMLNSGYQIVAIRHFPAVLVVLRAQFLKNRLHLVAILISVVVPFVQDQPELEAWIGTANENAVLFA